MNEAQHILNRQFEKKYFPKVQKAIKSQISSLIEVVESRGVNAGLSEANQIITSPVAPVIQSLYNEVGLRYARRTWRDLQEQKRILRGGRKALTYDHRQKAGSVADGPTSLKAFGFNARWVARIKRFLGRHLLQRITFDVAQTTKEAMIKVLQESIDKGWSIDKTVEQLEAMPISRTQAARIVRTEVTRAANTGVVVAGETMDFEQTKEWISAKDHRVRGVDPEDHASHVLLNGITIDFDEKFIDPRNQDELRFPGDPEAKAESTINCRCSMAVRLKYAEDGRPIRKRKEAVV